jgi:hypothetical protein
MTLVGYLLGCHFFGVKVYLIGLFAISVGGRLIAKGFRRCGVLMFSFLRDVTRLLLFCSQFSGGYVPGFICHGIACGIVWAIQLIRDLVRLRGG